MSPTGAATLLSNVSSCHPFFVSAGSALRLFLYFAASVWPQVARLWSWDSFTHCLLHTIFVFLYIEAINWLTHLFRLFKHVNTCLSICRKRKENITAYLISSKTNWWWLVLFSVLCPNLNNSLISAITVCLLWVVREQVVWEGSCKDFFIFFCNSALLPFCLSNSLSKNFQSGHISEAVSQSCCCWTRYSVAANQPCRSHIYWLTNSYTTCCVLECFHSHACELLSFQISISEIPSWFYRSSW